MVSYNKLVSQKNLIENKKRSQGITWKEEKVKRIFGCTAIKGICRQLNL